MSRKTVICLLIGGITYCWLCSAQHPINGFDTAWDELLKIDSHFARQLTVNERGLLQSLDGQDLEEVLDGLKELSPLAVDWWTVDGGGGDSAGGLIQLSGTIAQSDTATLTGATIVVNGGMWNESSSLFRDDFESGGTANWSSTSTSR